MSTIPLFPVPENLRERLASYKNSQLLGQHYRSGDPGPLRHGKTLFFRNSTISAAPYKTWKSHADVALEDFFASVGGVLVKAYYHRLDPGQVIDPHADISEYFNVARRYHIFLELPVGFSCTQEGSELRPYFVHSFDPRVMHGYENLSTDSVGFFVFDLIDEEQIPLFSFSTGRYKI